MKKKVLSMALMATIVLSMAGCGGNAETAVTTKSDEVTTAITTAKEENTEKNTTSAENDDKGEVTTTSEEERETTAEATTTTAPETEAVTTTTEAPKTFPKITNKPVFYDDCICFKASDKNVYIYNSVSNKMYNIDGVSSFTDVDGKLVVTGSSKAPLYNLETKEHYDFKAYKNFIYDYNSVYKVESGFEGETNYFGIIDKNGEWVLPMSSDYSICDSIETRLQVMATTPSYVVFNTGGSSAVEKIYDYKNDKIITHEFKPLSVVNVAGDSIAFIENTSISIYNISKDEYTATYENITEYGFSDKLFFLTSHENKYCAVFDENFTLLHEIKDYKVKKVYDTTEEYSVFSAIGADNRNYMVVTDKSGNTIYGPENGGIGDWAAYIVNDNVVLPNAKKIFNCKTGEIKDYECVKVISDKMLVISDGAYYLADPADPSTLINPFEIAE